MDEPAMLNSKQVAHAIQIFSLGRQGYPNSGKALASIAIIYLVNSETTLANALFKQKSQV